MVRSMPGFLSAMITTTVATIASITTVSATVAAAIPAIAPISPTIAATMATIAAVTPVRNSQTGSHTDRGNDQQYQQLKWWLKIHTKAIFVSRPLPSWHLHGDGAVDTGDISIVIDDLQKKSTTSIPISKKLGVWIFFLVYASRLTYWWFKMTCLFGGDHDRNRRMIFNEAVFVI